jgi:hypothetical protein
MTGRRHVGFTWQEMHPLLKDAGKSKLPPPPVEAPSASRIFDAEGASGVPSGAGLSAAPPAPATEHRRKN